MFKKFIKYFTVTEWILWLVSITVITVGFAVSAERSILSYLSSLAGATCVIFCAKGNVWGQVLGIVFSVIYSAYAYLQQYYGEMIIYLCIMIPIHTISIITWLKNKYNGKAHEVKVNSLRPLEYVLTGIVAVAVTVVFYFLLGALNTDNLIVSTISLTTSITAAYLMLRRCEIFSICFILNDVVLIVLWSLKIATAGLQVLPSVFAFVMFLANDTYCLISWQRLKKRQRKPLIQQDSQEQSNQPDTQSDEN